jgi:hypothetical protein
MLRPSKDFQRWIDWLLCCFVAGPSNIDPTASYTMADLTLTDDLTVAGAFTRQTVSQPIIRIGTGTLAGGTVDIPATWVTAGTVIQVTYTGAAAVADSPAYAIDPGVDFTVVGTGTNTFSWVAFTPQA